MEAKLRLPRPDFAGFLNVISREAEPNRVPLAELFHDQEIMFAIQGPPSDDSDDGMAAWSVAFWRDLGYDYITARTNVQFPRSGLDVADTAVLAREKRGWANENSGVITSWEEFEGYRWPEVTPESFRTLEATARCLPDGMKVVALFPSGVFENTTQLMGFSQFSYALAESPDLVKAIFQRVGETLCALVETTTSMEWVGAQWLNDDLGFRSGTLASPQVIREHVFPYYQRICDTAHRNGRPVFMHSCGKLDRIMDELIDDIGIDAKHSFEHGILPVWEAKRRWGRRVGLLGGVDMDLLARGTEDDVRAYTRRCVEECLPGGGWALGSGNSIANYVPVENFLAMLDEGRRAR